MNTIKVVQTTTFAHTTKPKKVNDMNFHSQVFSAHMVHIFTHDILESRINTGKYL